MEQLEVPVELVCHILGYAESLASLGRLRRVCQRWRDLIDSSPSLWARFSELEIEHSRIEPAALHRLCDRIVRLDSLRLVGCSKALHHPITTLLTAPQGSQVKVVHIENCDKITSDDVSLAAIVNNCPLLETLIFMSNNNKENKRPYKSWLAREAPLELALATVKPQLRLFQTNTLLPTETLLLTLGRYCSRVEILAMQHRHVRSSSDTPLQEGVLIDYEAWIQRSAVRRLGRLHQTTTNRPQDLSYVQDCELGTKSGAWSKEMRPCDQLTLVRYQLLDMGDDGEVTLVDDDGEIKEGVTLPRPAWASAATQAFANGGDVNVLVLAPSGGIAELVFNVACP